MWTSPASCRGARTVADSGRCMPNAMPSTRAAAGSGRTASTASTNRPRTQASAALSDGPCRRVTLTWGATAIARTPSRSRIASDSAPGRRPGARSPLASTSTVSSGARSGSRALLSRRPPETGASLDASVRWLTSTTTAPPPGSAERTVPVTITSRAPRWPSMVPGPGRSTAVAPRARPSAATPTSSATSSALRRDPRAEAASAARAVASAADRGSRAAYPIAVAAARQLQTAARTRPAGEPARRLTRRERRPGGSGPAH